MPRINDKRGGARPGAGRPKKVAITEVALAERKASGFEICQDYIGGQEFLLDVINMRFDRLAVAEIDLNQRIKAAIELLPFTNQKMPTKVEAKVDHSWAEAVREAEARRRGAAEDIAEGIIHAGESNPR